MFERTRSGIPVLTICVSLAVFGCGGKEDEKPAEPVVEEPSAAELEAARREQATTALGASLAETSQALEPLRAAADAGDTLAPKELISRIGELDQRVQEQLRQMEQLAKTEGGNWEAERQKLEGQLAELKREIDQANSSLAQWRQREQEAAAAPERGQFRVNRESGLIEGLDGGEYEPYLVSVVEHSQRHLRRLGIYAGPVDGFLDLATMQAIGRYQEAQGLQVSGVPSPMTRARLFESGS